MGAFMRPFWETFGGTRKCRGPSLPCVGLGPPARLTAPYRERLRSSGTSDSSGTPAPCRSRARRPSIFPAASFAV